MPVMKLDPHTLPLTEQRLIEASAGTGKTYTISGLYLRLLLGDSNQAALTCDKILVVTFTNAATEELRDRIRQRIKKCYQRFIGLTIDDPFIETLYQQCSDEGLHLALQRLELALKSLDEAAIFTIHGFCQRILSDMAFESALLFESEFTIDDSEYLHHSVRDFWRNACYGIEEYLASALTQAKLATPDALMGKIRSLLGASQAIVKSIPAPFSHYSHTLQSRLSKLQLAWESDKDATLKLLHDLPLHGSSYGNEKANYPKLAALFNDMDNWSLQWHKGLYRLPPAKVLDKLALHNIRLKKNGVLPTSQQAPLLAQIEEMSISLSDLLPAFIYEAKNAVNERFNTLKQERNILSPDDLLLTLAAVIDNNSIDTLETDSISAIKQLTTSIANRYPVALIDEFQDTDPLQFAIFSGIYTSSCQPAQLDKSKIPHALLMIGDPKQAIYAFRGADIFTYINAKKQTPHHYNLDTNYRSSSAMISAVNALFNKQNAFMNNEIPFETVKAADKGQKKLNDLSINQQALQIKLLAEDPEKGLNKITARQQLADDAANEIARLLNEAQDNHCTLQNGLTCSALTAKNIAILVRDRHEAAVMREALNKRNIGAVFLSRDSVFETQEAKEMLLILRAIAEPKNENAIRSALASKLLGYSAYQITAFNQSEDERAKILSQFIYVNEIWQNRGIMPALMNLASSLNLLHRLKQEKQAERRLTDFRHLAELLQQKSTELDGISALLHWFEQELNLHRSGDEQQMRLESEKNLVQIVTIHKSKGLEYPVCFLPFISLARNTNNIKPSPMLYHENEQLIWDIEGSSEGYKKYLQEQLAEDIRLFYVALTRPIYRCYLSIAHHCRISSNGKVNSYLYSTAIGYLLGISQNDIKFDTLESQANAFVSNSISVMNIDKSAPEISFIVPAIDENSIHYSALTPAAKPQLPWRVGSYSGLVKHSPHEKIAPGFDDEGDELISFDEENPDMDDNLLTRFNFEKGANAGSFLHLVMELIDFTDPDHSLDIHLPQAMAQYAIHEDWLAPLKNWYLDILNTKLDQHDDSLKLNKITNNQKLVEMEFYLPLAQIQAQSLSQLLSQYGYQGNIKFDEFKGMLKGFIDLTFEYKNKYYIADYKSNYLGNKIDDYNESNMSYAIKQHRYDLQYLIYSLALHRFLQLKIPHYDYDTHFGGCYYLFLRGMSCDKITNGVYFDKPNKLLIEALDDLFSTPIVKTKSIIQPKLGSMDKIQ